MADSDVMDDNASLEGSKAGGKKLVLILSVLMLLAGGAGAAWFFLFSNNETEEDEAQRRAQAPVQYVDLSPSFIVNFPHQGRQRFLQAELTVMSRDPAALEAVRQHMPIIRHNLINLFNAQLLLVFENPSGIEQLRELATEEVKQVLRNEIGRDGIDEVLFTAFVMQ
jgi:flagellar FliL protein